MKILSLCKSFTLIAAFLCFAPASAFALCAAPTVDAGVYVNFDRHVRSITRARLHVPACRDHFAIPADATPEERERILRPRGPRHYVVRLWGKCHPRDCSWGGARGQVRRNRAGKYLAARYNQGFAERYVTVRKTGVRTIQVVVHTRYRDSRRPQRWVVNMRKVGR